MQIEVTHDPLEEDTQIIIDGLMKFNSQYFSLANSKKLAIYLKDDQGKIIGGLTGKLNYTQLYIDLLWVNEAERGKGFGSQLLKAAQYEAGKFLVETIFLDTFSFQAPDFYERHGFRKVGELRNYPKEGISRFFYEKCL